MNFYSPHEKNIIENLFIKKEKGSNAIYKNWINNHLDNNIEKLWDEHNNVVTHLLKSCDLNNNVFKKINLMKPNWAFQGDENALFILSKRGELDVLYEMRKNYTFDDYFLNQENHHFTFYVLGQSILQTPKKNTAFFRNVENHLIMAYNLIKEFISYIHPKMLMQWSEFKKELENCWSIRGEAVSDAFYDRLYAQTKNIDGLLFSVKLNNELPKAKDRKKIIKI